MSSYREEDEAQTRGQKHRVFTYEEIHAATSGFSASALLGRGSHGSVYRASLDQGRLLAAAKLPSLSSASSGSPSATDSEIDLLSSLPRSPLFVNLVGATPASGPSPRIPVVDFMPHGSLYDLLHDPPAGTMGYLDPGYVRPVDASTRTDVYSFGVVLLEVLTGREAIDVEYSPPSLVDWATPLLEDGRFEELWDPRAAPADRSEEEAARAVAEVAGRCLTPAAGDRPSMAEVVTALRAANRRRLLRLALRRAGKRSHPPNDNKRVSDVAGS
ncbi:hypothetical protein MUK42_12648 [Musa troglodytarum]|uniref:Protein kinase domain-containing protein n=1 Tax=Musa troglodytarum TaxID=320322 RepID=A0A9E7GFU4_9LILI|nr:hypothetical protein MUK42_12648 [Musa troglodytarum]